MANQILNIHSKTPELRKIQTGAEALKGGSVILYPTDTGFTLGCELSNKSAISKLRSIRKLPLTKSLTFLCDSLSNISEFAKVSNKAYKTIRGLIPGPYTFILPATKNVPKFAQNPKRKTSGIRVPDNDLSQLLLKNLGQPIISISARIENEDYFETAEEIVEYFAPKVDLAVRSDKYNFTGESTVVDMTQDIFQIVRHGAGITNVLEFVEYEEE
jgi:tRNA threonylcarbamoyl adenosine modification protein (Sua5/YciO/YrdC/YwlC family)